MESLDKALTARNSLVVEQLTSPGKALVIAHAAAATKRPLLIITGAGSEEFQLANDLPYFAGAAPVELPAWETLPAEQIAPSPEIVGARYKALQALTPRSICLTTLQGALQKVPSPQLLQSQALTLRQGAAASFEQLLQRLLELGYERKTSVADKSDYAVRGGIVDIFPPTRDAPVRVEFWGDVIDSIRTFDPGTQRSQGIVDYVELSAGKETGSALVPLLDYLPNPIVVLDDLVALEDRYATLLSLGATPSGAWLAIEQFLDLIAPMQLLFLPSQPLEQLADVAAPKAGYYSQPLTPVRFELFQRHYEAQRWNHKLRPLEADLGTIAATHPPCTFLAQNDADEAQLRKALEFHHIDAPIERGYLSEGLAIDKQLLFPSTELTHRIKVHREQQPSFHYDAAAEVYDLAPGELVVHFHHGIGKYLGIEKRDEQEFFLIEYANNSRLYVPLMQANLISRYVGATAKLPTLHALGAARWQRQREQTERALIGYAADLLKLHAEREHHGGFAFAADGPDTKAFDEEFPYIETDDQLAAIRDTKTDMCSPRAMDRLICGDVGYGKTEVTLRAAFKAVLDGRKQVALLVPTTVLAIQHYETFRDRMAHFGVRVEVLSRFTAPQNIKEAIKGLAAGSVDIVVGTHRLLQRDVHFHDLGLLIIDEEQRFGVKAKEHIKRLKATIDCLTLTATPIPRTLYLSLVGARDLSVIATPPQDRVPIKTAISEPNDQLITTALLRELSRDGQAYFIHNRVETIFARAQHLQKLLPKARLVVGHGQMGAEELDTVFHAFKRGQADILVATSIIENGIDIPNANTIIVDNAQQFGIADLYQLRGRVGRSNRRAYAYFLLPRHCHLSDITQKRLDALASSSGYGGGMRVAMRDLELRGAGDILGVEQSGHVADIGFHLYCKLLKRTVDSLQGKPTITTVDMRFEIPFEARLDDLYVNDVTLRMELYQRFGDATTLEEIDTLWTEIKDRFGRPPERAQWLYVLSRLRLRAAQRGFTHIKVAPPTMSYERRTPNGVAHNKVLIATIRKPDDLERVVGKIIDA